MAFSVDSTLLSSFINRLDDDPPPAGGSTGGRGDIVRVVVPPSVLCHGCRWPSAVGVRARVVKCPVTPGTAGSFGVVYITPHARGQLLSRPRAAPPTWNISKWHSTCAWNAHRAAADTTAVVPRLPELRSVSEVPFLVAQCHNTQKSLNRPRFLCPLHGEQHDAPSSGLCVATGQS